MKKLPVLAIGLAAAMAALNWSQTAQGQSDGWVTLLDGSKMGDWTEVGKANWAMKDGALVEEGPAAGLLADPRQPYTRTLVASDFVDALLADRETPLAEAQALTHLTTNVLGAANKRAAARWIDATLTSLKFEKEVRFGPDSPVAKLAQLADLQRGVKAAGLNETDQLQLSERIGDIGGLIEADAKLTAAVAKAAAPAGHRLTLLLRLACAETAPVGPASERARIEALKLARAAEVRAELASSPSSLERLKSLMTATGEAA